MKIFFNGLDFKAFEQQFKADLQQIINTLYPEVSLDIIYALYKRKCVHAGSITADPILQLNWSEKKFRENEGKEEDYWKFGGITKSAFGEIAVKRGNFELKRAFAGTYTKSSFAFVESREEDKTFVQWVIDGNEADNSFFHFYGKTLPDEFIANERHLRFYFHLNGASPYKIKSIKKFIQQIVFELDRRRIPFDIKAVNSTDKMFADGAVLYLEQRYFTTIAGFIIQICEKNKHIFNDSVPMFSYKLTKGLSFTESVKTETGGEVSFGKQRSKVLFEILRKYDSKPTLEQIMIDIDKIGETLSGGKNKEWAKSFFKNHFSTYEYNFLKSEEDEFSYYRYIENRHLYLATSIGYKICKEAIWTKGLCCNWIHRSMERDGDYYENLDEFYLDGISGTALYLSKLFLESKLKIFKQHTIGAVSSLLEILYEESYTFKYGFHKGTLGTLWVLYEINDDLKLEIEHLLNTLLVKSLDFIKDNLDTTEECSLFYGIAGTLFGITNISKFYEVDTLPFSKLKEISSSVAKRLRVLQSNNIDFQHPDIEINDLSLWKSTINYGRNYDVYPLGFGNGSAGILSVIAYYQKKFNISDYDDVIERAFKSEEISEGKKPRLGSINIFIRPDFTKGDIYASINSSINVGQNGVYLSVVILKYLGYENQASKITEKEVKEIYKQALKKSVPKKIAILTHDAYNKFENTETGYFDIITEIAKQYDKPLYQYFDKIDSLNDKVLSGSYYPNDRKGVEYFSPSLQGLSGIGYCYLRLMMKSKLPTYHFPMYEVQNKSGWKKAEAFFSKNSPYHLVSQLFQ